MEREFVTYDIALRLKELGFNEPCFTYFASNSKNTLFDPTGNTYTNSDFKDQDEIYIAAPLWDQVIDWLIEDYFQFVECKISSYSWAYYTTNTVTFDLIVFAPGYNNRYEAREAGIIEALDRIIEQMDLFENLDKVPGEVRSLIDAFNTYGESYEDCERLLADLKPYGYTFDYYLDAVPFNLRKITA
jgi:hypothetical protein